MITIKSKESERNQAYSNSSLSAWIGKKTEDTRKQRREREDTKEDTWSKNITFFHSFPVIIIVLLCNFRLRFRKENNYSTFLDTHTNSVTQL